MASLNQVAYGSLLHDRRRDLHAQIVEAIETLYSERIDEQVERLATTQFAAKSGRRR